MKNGILQEKIVDMTGQNCVVPVCKGRYQEQSIHDDMDGVLHCTKCRTRVERYQVQK